MPPAVTHLVNACPIHKRLGRQEGQCRIGIGNAARTARRPGCAIVESSGPVAVDHQHHVAGFQQFLRVLLHVGVRRPLEASAGVHQHDGGKWPLARGFEHRIGNVRECADRFPDFAVECHRRPVVGRRNLRLQLLGKGAGQSGRIGINANRRPYLAAAAMQSARP